MANIFITHTLLSHCTFCLCNDWHIDISMKSIQWKRWKMETRYIQSSLNLVMLLSQIALWSQFLAHTCGRLSLLLYTEWTQVLSLDSYPGTRYTLWSWPSISRPYHTTTSKSRLVSFMTPGTYSNDIWRPSPELWRHNFFSRNVTYRMT